MKNKFLLSALLFIVQLFSSQIKAQQSTLPLPLNIQRAYENRTRTFEGKPGLNYWQNNSVYKIKAELDPVSRKLSGEESIVYFNNSPDTLTQIVLHLYPDFYRKGNARDFEVDADVINDGAVIEKLIVNGEELKIDGGKTSPRREGTNLFIPLSKNLFPKRSVEIKIDWNYTIANKSQVRTGAYDNTSFFVAYWYPQIAVYDDIDGWDVLSYTGQAEMYNDFNDYEVEITVPEGFLLWSTGVLQNPEEVYSQNVLERYKNASRSDKIINIVTKKDSENRNVTTDKEKLVYKIRAEYVPDFAFAVSDHYLWDASSLVVDKQTGRRTFISAAYNKNTEYFSNVAEIARKAIESFSAEIPGVPYPYPLMTVFNGQGGMEFPMMCNDSAIEDLIGTVHVTSHEICHTYFPFYMGINEKKYAWMDEGWATMLPFDFQTEKAPGYDPRTRNAQSYSEFAGSETDTPPRTLSYLIKNPAYRTASYRRPGAAYEFLRQFLGDEKFLKALHEYMDRWNGKHPLPYDFFFTFDQTTGENLDWYWKPWFFENNYPDLTLSANKVNNEIKITVKNKGGLPLPVIIKFYFEDGTEEIIFSAAADLWKDGKTEILHTTGSKEKVKRIELGTTQVPDVNLEDNVVVLK
ncbi:MAG: M1 family metallopeptidase [Bacteroidota bacterium]